MYRYTHLAFIIESVENDCHMEIQESGESLKSDALGGIKFQLFTRKS